MSPPPSAAGPPPGSEEPQVPPEFLLTSHPWPGLDRLGITQAIGGLALGLIALFSSYDHLTFAGRNIPISQQWGIPLIAASVATVFVDAELASGSRLRAADQRQSDGDRAEQRENEADRERNLAGEERQRADRERNLAGEERQRANRERNLAGEERQRADRERNRADQERNRADEARERQAENTKRQNAALDLLRRSALLSARVQLDPSDTNRARLQTFLALLNQTPEADSDL